MAQLPHKTHFNESWQDEDVFKALICNVTVIK